MSKSGKPCDGVGNSSLLWLPILSAALSCGWFLLAEHRIAGQWGYSLDDSWIYATFARNLASGHGYSFNPGEQIGGATGPLYVFLLAGLYALFRDVIWPAKVLGIACLAASSFLVSKVVRKVAPAWPWLAVLAGVLVATSPPLVWGAISGLEFPVYLLFTCLGLYFLISERWVLASLFWSLGVWLRPDGIFLALVWLVARPKPSSKNAAAPTIVTAAILGSYFLFNQIVGQSWLPNSVGVKANLAGNIPAREWSMLGQWLWLWGLSIRAGRFGLHAPVLVPLLVTGAVLGARRWPAIPLYTIGFPIAFALSGANGGQNGRYIAYVIPFGILLSCITLVSLARRVRRHSAWLAGIAVICFAWQICVDQIMGINYGWNVQNINRMHRYIAERVRTGLSPGDTVAVNDVGAMGYFSGCYVVDLVGLVSKKRAFPENLRLYKPKLLVIFPDWFREYAKTDPVTGQGIFYDADSTFKYSPVIGVQLRNNTIASRNTMCVFERMGLDQTGPRDVRLIVH